MYFFCMITENSILVDQKLGAFDDDSRIIFLHKNVGNHYNSLDKAILMSTHNISCNK